MGVVVEEGYKYFLVVVRVGDGLDEAAGARLGNVGWWRLVHGQWHGIHATLAHTGIALRGDFLGERRSEFMSSQSQSSAPSNNAVRSTFSPAEKSGGAGLTRRGVVGGFLGDVSGVGTACQNWSSISASRLAMKFASSSAEGGISG